MGLQLKIPGATFSADKPVLNTIDDIQSSGSLALFDVSHPDQNFTLASSPAYSSVTNLFASNAATILGTSPANCVLKQQRVETDAGSNFFETTTKGGIHVVSATSGQTGANFFALVNGTADALENYVESNISTNDFYFSQWITLTRETNKTSTVNSTMMYNLNTGAYAFYWEGGNTTPAIPGSPDSFTQEPSAFTTKSAGNVGQNVRRAIKTNGYNSWSGNASLYYTLLGNGGAWTPFNLDSGLGLILYRTYVEDLTVSGRTFEEVDAIDSALHAAAFSEGGVFYGDTYSDPDTVRP